MPSPIAHLGAGYAIYQLYRYRLPPAQRRVWKLPLQPAMVAGLSMLPDLDIIAAAVFRDTEKYHNNFSHSLLLGVPAAFLLAGIFYTVYRSGLWLWFGVSFVSYESHILMDALTAERGVMMLWPLTQARFVSPIRIFYGLQWGLGWFSPWHLWTVLTESLFVMIVVVAAHYLVNRGHRADSSSLNDRKPL